MKVRLLCTAGTGQFDEVIWDKPEILSTEIEVRSIMTGVCRSDIDMMTGKFQTLPLSMQGHEGLGQVTKVGDTISSRVKVGDYVATRGEPAYADYYNVQQDSFVIVPTADPKYILEPVACGINIITQNMSAIIKKFHPRILILGSGFLAYTAYNTILHHDEITYSEIVIVGNSNKKV